MTWGVSGCFEHRSSATNHRGHVGNTGKKLSALTKEVVGLFFGGSQAHNLSFILYIYINTELYRFHGKVLVCEEGF